MKAMNFKTFLRTFSLKITNTFCTVPFLRLLKLYGIANKYNIFIVTIHCLCSVLSRSFPYYIGSMLDKFCLLLIICSVLKTDMRVEVY